MVWFNLLKGKTKFLFVQLLSMLLLLSGCATTKQPTLNDIDPSKGIVVGVVFESSLFGPHGAYFFIQAPDGGKITISSGAENRSYTIKNVPPKTPLGVGKPFILQLPPGKYQVVGWALDYGRIKKSQPPANPVEFEVVAGKISYLGHFSANRFTEVAAILQKYDEDIPHVRKNTILSNAIIGNNALSVYGWELPDASINRIKETPENAKKREKQKNTP
jgi:hypothetical protein